MRAAGSKHPRPLLGARLTLQGHREPLVTSPPWPPAFTTGSLCPAHSPVTLPAASPQLLQGIFTALFRAIHPVHTGCGSKAAGEPHSCRLHSQFVLRVQVLQQSWPKPSPWHIGRGQPSIHVSGSPAPAVSCSPAPPPCPAELCVLKYTAGCHGSPFGEGKPAAPGDEDPKRISSQRGPSVPPRCPQGTGRMNTQSCFTMPTPEPRQRNPFVPGLLSTSAPGSTRRGGK